MIDELIIGYKTPNIIASDISALVLADTWRDESEISATLTELCRFICSKYASYEISNYDDYFGYLYVDKLTSDNAKAKCLDEWGVFVTSVFDTHYEYYRDKLAVYKSTYLDSMTSDTIKEKLKELITTNNHYYGTTKNKHSDLPNKKIDADDIYNYPTDTDYNDSDSNTDSTDNTMLLSLYRSYLNGVKNIMNEFAGRFEDCFCHSYYTEGRLWL